MGQGDSRPKRTGVLFTLIVILTLGSLMLTSWVYLEKANRRHALERHGFVEILFQELLAQRAELLHAAIDRIMAREDLHRTMKDRDRTAFRENAKPFFDHLQAEFGISHFYVHTPLRQVFLRLHKPEQFGERINRYLLDQAFGTRQSVSGIELGTHGTLTLRNISPWIVEGRLIGYIELGEETDRIVRKVQDLTGVELLATVQKTFLNRAVWEEGMRMLDRPARWGRFEDRVLIARNISAIANRMVLGLIRNNSREMTMEAEGKTYFGKLMPIRNAIDLSVGDFLVVIDVTEEAGRVRRAMTLMSALCLVLAACWTWGIVRKKK